MLKLISLFLILFNIVYSGEYNRKNWRHWIDDDRDGFDTRQEVLIEENLADTLLVTYVNGKKRVIKGLWICPYTGDSITNPKKLDIDHFVPLGNAYESGGKNWSKDKKKLYANYLKNPKHLVAVKSSANRSKGKKSPDRWMPEKNKCEYLITWVLLKQFWELEMTFQESAFISKEIFRNECGVDKKGLND